VITVALALAIVVGFGLLANPYVAKPDEDKYISQLLKNKNEYVAITQKSAVSSFY